MKSMTPVSLALSILLFASSGCGRRTEANTGGKCSTAGNCDRQELASTDSPAKVKETPAIAGIAFIDLEEACACTRRRIEASWKALQAALGEKSNIQVDRIHFDSQEELAEPYRQQKPFQVLPAIYFMDAKQNVVEMLQGEPTVKQIGEVLKGASR